MEPTSQKRHEALQPLSRHHHHALVLAQMLIKQNEDVESMRVKTINFWERGGREHFREEEEVLLPEYAKYQPIDIPEIRGLLLEHITIRSLVSEIAEGAGLDKMLALGTLLRDHVRREEQVVFPMVEQGIPPEALVRLQPYFEEHQSASIHRMNPQ